MSKMKKRVLSLENEEEAIKRVVSYLNYGLGAPH